jgi:Mg2+/Co2+ transporter CorB
MNSITNALLRLFGVSANRVESRSLSADELRTVVAETGALIPQKHQQMLLGILDLEHIQVEDIMVPRQDVVGIDLDRSWDDNLNIVREAEHTRLPIYHGDLDHIVGVLHLKRVTRELARGEFSRERLVALAKSREPYYVPASTRLTQQLAAFQENRRRHAYVVDEYGGVIGLVTIDDILEEVVGEFTSLPYAGRRDVHPEDDGSYILQGAMPVRTLNRLLGWHLPTEGPRTLNGLILEYLETIPEAGTSLKLAHHLIEVLKTSDNAVKTLRIWPPAH